MTPGGLCAGGHGDDHRPSAVSVISPRRAESWRARVLDYVALTKPQIMMLLLITAAGGAFPAASGVPPTGALVGVLAGGVLASCGAGASNHGLDRHPDELMGRTRDRLEASRPVSARAAAGFGLVLSALSLVVFAVSTNWLATPAGVEVSPSLPDQT